LENTVEEDTERRPIGHSVMDGGVGGVGLATQLGYDGDELVEAEVGVYVVRREPRGWRHPSR
jgi:hypothetical protein